MRGQNEPPEAGPWRVKRDALFRSWAKAGIYNPAESWARCATHENKIIMCVEAHKELGWSRCSFDSKMEAYNNRRRSIAAKRKRRSIPLEEVPCRLFRVYVLARVLSVLFVAFVYIHIIFEYHVIVM